MIPVLHRILLVAFALTAIPVAVCAQEQAAPPQTALPQAWPEQTAPLPATPPREKIVLPHIDIKSADGATTLIAHLFRPKETDTNAAAAPRPAVVMLHGCSGLLANNGRFFPIYRAWARALLQQGYVVLVVDSASSRGFGQTCSAGDARRTMWRERPGDAYAALGWLQAQPFVQADRVAVMGWSQGGGVVLLTINDKSIGRPAGLKQDFAAGVAFYPGVCNDKFQSQPFTTVAPYGWTSRVPLLVLTGAADTWTPLAPCEDFLNAAKARGNPVEMKIYPDAVHSFDAPNIKRRELPEYTEPDGRVPVIATDPAARTDAFARVPAWLAEKLRSSPNN